MTTDARGRVRVPVERREALLDEFERSGLSGVKFAQMAGLKYPIPRLRDPVGAEATQSAEAPARGRAADRDFCRSGG
jgi:hypothetical protein